MVFWLTAQGLQVLQMSFEDQSSLLSSHTLQTWEAVGAQSHFSEIEPLVLLPAKGCEAQSPTLGRRRVNED